MGEHVGQVEGSMVELYRSLLLPAPAINKIPKRRNLFHDHETYCDLDLTNVGADVYTRHPSFEILMTAYAFGYDDPVRQWIPAEGQTMPADLEDALHDERVIKRAWNAPFEMQCWSNGEGIIIPPEQWRCTMTLAMSLSLPGKLEKAGPVVGIPEDKQKHARGKALMRVFSQPRKPTKTKLYTRVRWHMEPVKWEEYLAYNRGDVEAERAILKLIRHYDMPEEEWELWFIDQKINRAGIPINMKVVDNAVSIYEDLINTGMRNLHEITGLANPNSGPQLLPWLKDHGYPFDDLKKGHVARALEPLQELELTGHITETERTLAAALQIRSETSSISPKKYHALARCVDRVDMVLRNAFQFAGAGRTWRWAGRMFQPQNLPRPAKEFEKIMERAVAWLEVMSAEEIGLIYKNPMSFIVSCIRSVAQAPDGHMLYDADLNAIENRVLGWIANCKKILRVFERNRDPYVDFATYMYRLPYDQLWAEYKAGNGAKRQIAKPAVLGCGYQLGPGEERVNHKTGEIEATGLLGYAWNMYVKMTAEEAKHAVAVWRETYGEVVSFWYALEKAAKRCVRTGQPTECNMLRFDIKGPFLRMVLPSGRALHYCRPRIEPVRAPWGEMKDTLTYEGLNDSNQWIRISTHGGKLTENADQAIARDLLGHGMKLAFRRGLDLRIHVHDQIVGVAPDVLTPGSNMTVAEQHLAILIECMEDQPEWAHGLPLKSNGFVSKVFMKD